MILQTYWPTKIRLDTRLVLAILGLLTAVISVAVFQDYLHSQRNGYPFFWEESLLFKCVWLIFPLGIIWVKRQLNKDNQSSVKAARIFALVTAGHVMLVPLIVWVLSSILRDQSYGMVKVLTYTLANDLVKIALVYASVICLMRFYPLVKAPRVNSKELSESIIPIDSLSVKSGTSNKIIKYNEMLFIESATPYVKIYTIEQGFLHTTSLKALLLILDQRFIRVHRSYIVNLDKVTSYQSRLNGDYDLVLHDGSSVRLSRNYVKAFKRRFDKSSA